MNKCRRAMAIALVWGACGDSANNIEETATTASTTTFTTSSTTTQVPTTGATTETSDGTSETSTTSSEVTPRRVVAGTFCTCMLWQDGGLRCWGNAFDDCTGWGEAYPQNIGDDETPASVGDVPAPFDAVDLAIGSHSCAVTDTGEVWCWGESDEGQLGTGKLNMPARSAADAMPADVGVGAVHVAVGERHTCVVTEAANVRCWGSNTHGQLGYGSTEAIGDDESPAVVGDVSLGGPAVKVVAGGSSLGGAHTCALLTDGTVRCWGWTVADFGEKGAGILGYGNLENIGDDELPNAAGPVPLGGPVNRIAAGARHTCAVRMDGALLCWGLNGSGRLGLGHTDDIGDDETPDPAGVVSLGRAAVDVAAALESTCALLDNGEVRCWGSGEFGTLGYGNTMNLGDDELPSTLGPIDLGGTPPVQLVAGRLHICALLEDDALRCWGSNMDGQLGYGNVLTIGDDEVPANAGDVPYR